MEQKSTILIADDEPAIRDALQEMLSMQGYDLVFAANGLEALEKAQEVSPDLILLDIMLPFMDGFQVCRNLRSDPLLTQVPIIMITALADTDSRLKGIKAGADEFLSKPFDPTELLARVRTITQLNRYRQLLAERSKFERVVELSPNGILIVDAEGTIHLTSPAALKLLGHERKESITGKSCFDFVAPDQIKHWAIFLKNIITNTSQTARTETSITLPSGEILAVEVDAGHFTWNDKPAAQIVIRDITERKRAEKQIECQIQRLDTLRNIDLAITNNMDLHSTLHAFLKQVTGRLALDAASILLLDPHSQMLEYTAGQGFFGKAITASRLRLGESNLEDVAAQCQIINMPNLLKTGQDFIRTRGLQDEKFSSYYAVPLINKSQIKGLLEIFHRQPLHLDQEWLDFLKALAIQAVIAIENAELVDNVQRTHTELFEAYDATLEGWSRALELRDKETKDHTRRVTEMTVRLAREMGLSQEALIHIRRGALLHDIGKMGIPDGILLKPGPLTGAEEEIMQKHPVYAYELLSPISYLRPALDIPYCHHEKWDGSGYPRGLRGQEIPLAARIFAIVDVWDALRSNRPYRPAWPKEKVYAHISEQAGIHFDPRIVEFFLKLES